MIKFDQEKPLNIYRASAGSGKTHLLTGFYIKLLFQTDLALDGPNNISHFSEILAVTFTNKATAEMKGRIIEQLYKLSCDPEHSDYWKDVNPTGNKTPQQISRRAHDLLVQILNDYASFNISTIDSFFQRVVRSFARELNVTGNYEIELDVNKALDTTLVNFLDKLNERDHKEAFEWLLKFSKKRMEEGAGWDFRESLLTVATKALTSESYRNHSQQIKEFTNDKKALVQYEKMLRDIRKGWKETLIRLGQEGCETLERYGLTAEDFAYKFPSKFAEWARYESGEIPEPKSRFIDAARDTSKWFSKKSPYAKGLPDEQTTAIQDILLRCTEHFEGQPYRLYQTAIAIEKNLYELGIMANIDDELKAYCDEQNIMLLSSTNELISRLIGPGDAPFIYEKTGSKIKSYMIDEFQDTSGMQWGNFVPLIDNALSQGHQNLIVGDVKQSIYRWRGSDWSLLDTQLDDYHPGIHQEDETALRTNWRSLPAIIDFNNHFFQDTSSRLDTLTSTSQISRIYKDVEQQIPAKRKGEGAPQGLVKIEFLKVSDEDGNIIDSPTAEQKEEEAMRRLPLQVIELQQHGFRPKDIAILCRRKNECYKAAKSLLKYKQDHPECPYGMDIISNEALLISSRLSVQCIISILRHFQTPDSDILRMIALSSFLQLEGKSPSEALDSYFHMSEEENPFKQTLAHHPLYEMIEQIIGHFPQPIQHQDTAFLQAFRDLVLSFTNTQGADLSSFLEWWDQSGCSKAIATPDGQDAIQIMTIHQSKGLGVPAVILPYASWEMDLDTSHGEIIWCQPSEEPFTKEVLLPIKLDKQLANTIFSKEFAEERLRAVIDNLNTAYVAFTRAEEAMIIMAPTPKGTNSCKLENFLQAFCNNALTQDTYVSGQWGRKEIPQEKKDTAEAIPLVGDSALFPEANPLPKISILHSPKFPDVTAKHKGSYIHRALQEIRTADKAQEAVHSLYLRGYIDNKIISEAEMQQVIHTMLSDPQVKSWFAGDLRIFNEQTLADKEGTLQRPDRIVIDAQGHVTVIDYKTGDDHKGYRKQVAKYMHLLQQIGFNNVEGYLLFIKECKVVKVKA